MSHQFITTLTLFHQKTLTQCICISMIQKLDMHEIFTVATDFSFGVADIKLNTDSNNAHSEISSQTRKGLII